jgi:invasion protein IalB
MITQRVTAILAASVLAVALSGPLLAQSEQDQGAEPDVAAPQKSETPRRPAAPKAAAKPAPKAAAAQPVASPVPAATAPAPAVPPAPASAAAQLPNGASSITETYDDWIVNCGVDKGAKVCIASQSQGNKETGQKVFAIQLAGAKDGRTEGAILMPFGLALDAGIALKLDEKELGKGLRFSTCIPQGCLVPIALPGNVVDDVKKATSLVVSAIGVGNNQPVTFTVSLKGFAAALERIAALNG